MRQRLAEGPGVSASSTAIRVLRQAAIFALVGVFITLLLAWPLPLILLRMGWNKHEHGRREPWTSPSGIHCGVQISHLTFSDWYMVRPVRMEDSRALLGDHIRLPAWVAYPPAPNTNLYNIDTAATGWPWRSMTSESWVFRNRPETPSGEWREELRGNLELLKLPSGRIILPLRPIWGGLLGDSALYAITSWMLLNGLGTLRGIIRSRRGRCPRCGYDIRNAPPPCPECGHAQGIPERSHTSTSAV